jgi:hypothetical protein
MLNFKALPKVAKFVALALLVCLANAARAVDSDTPNYPLPKRADYPSISQTGNDISNFVPTNWKVLGKTQGDLNGDKLPDIVVVVKGNSKKFITSNKELNVTDFDTNPRMLLILFKAAKSGGYTLAERNCNFIPIPDQPTMDEPFQDVSIKSGILQLDFIWFTGIGGTTFNSSYKFRYQNNQFALIGADTCNTDRNAGNVSTHSFNFLTKKVKVAKGTTDNDSDKIQWKTIGIQKLKNLDDFKKLYAWEVLPGVFL